MSGPERVKLLVLGYGNELRGDDGAGPRVAAAVAEWNLNQVRGVALHQLTPDLAAPIAHAEGVVFVDARFASGRQDVEVTPVVPEPGVDVAAHISDPRALLALARALFGRCPPAWLITIPASNFDFGAGLSPATEQGIAPALSAVRRLLSQ